MQRLVELIGAFAARIGAPGLLLVAFLDSSFIPLPQVVDVLIVVFVIKNPQAWPYYAMMATAGSVAGCYALYALGRRGGDALVRRRFQERHIERGLAMFQRYGLFAVTIPAMLPPPTPFKIFVLLAGVSKVHRGTFVLAVAVGRGFRYGGEALLAYLYGEQAARYIRENLPVVSIWAAGLIGVVGAAYLLWRRHARRRMSAQQP